jgi:NADH-ubiquinone oxidoreductase chain 2
LAFSTISHVGFILLGLSIHTVESTQAFMFYIIQYSVSNLNAFMIILAIGYSLYCYVYKVKSTDINKEKANSKENNENNKDIFELIQDLEKEGNNDNSKNKKVELIKDLEENLSELIKDLDKYNGYSNEIQNKDLNEIQNKDVNKIYSKEKNELHKEDNSENLNNLHDINNSPIQLIDQLKGYYYINPLLSLSLAITLFSFAGIPPLIGFFGKQMILSAAIDNGYIFMSLVAILTSVISAVYYLAIIKQVFFNKPDYVLNNELDDFYADGLIVEKNSIVKKVNILKENIVLSGYLSLSISIITIIITLFIFLPEELLRVANLLALIFFNL